MGGRGRIQGIDVTSGECRHTLPGSARYEADLTVVRIGAGRGEGLLVATDERPGTLSCWNLERLAQIDKARDSRQGGDVGDDDNDSSGGDVGDGSNADDQDRHPRRSERETDAARRSLSFVHARIQETVSYGTPPPPGLRARKLAWVGQCEHSCV